MSTCDACMEVMDGLVMDKICGSSCRARMCKECFERYLTMVADSSICGVVKTICCPLCIRPVNFHRLYTLMKKHAALEKISEAISKACEIRCPNCHNMDCLLPKKEAKTIEEHSIGKEIVKELLAHVPKAGHDKVPGVVQKCFAYCAHELTPEEIFTSLQDLNRYKMMDMMKIVLKHIFDVERRTRLFLFWKNRSPQSTTYCCGTSVCFKCKIAGYHRGRPCQSNLDMSSEMAQCPRCFLFLVKGDGCNSVQCYCGHSFEWNEQVKAFERQLLLEKINPKPFKQVCSYLRLLVQKKKFRRNVLPCLDKAMLNYKLKRITKDLTTSATKPARNLLLKALYYLRYRRIVRDMPIHLLEWQTKAAIKKNVMMQWLLPTTKSKSPKKRMTKARCMKKCQRMHAPQKPIAQLEQLDVHSGCAKPITIAPPAIIA